MKINFAKCKNAIGFHLLVNRDVNLSIYLFKGFSLTLDFKTDNYMGVQFTELKLGIVYFHLVTPTFLVWVTDQKLMNFALNILKQRLNDIEDNLAEYLLNDSEDLNHDAIAESQVIYQLINFYGDQDND